MGSIREIQFMTGFTFNEIQPPHSHISLLVQHVQFKLNAGHIKLLCMIQFEMKKQGFTPSSFCASHILKLCQSKSLPQS